MYLDEFSEIGKGFVAKSDERKEWEINFRKEQREYWQDKHEKSQIKHIVDFDSLAKFKGVA